MELPEEEALASLTKAARKAIELAIDETRHAGHHYIETQDLLIGILRMKDSVGAWVLNQLGVDLERVRAKLAQIGEREDVERPTT